jgi:hypothetical protein
MMKIQAYSDKSGTIKAEITDITSRHGGLSITQDSINDTIFIDGPYVEGFIRKLRKLARKGSMYPKKGRHVGPLPSRPGVI